MPSGLKNAFRDALALLPKLGLVRKPSFHADGISFVLPVKDEERWIKPCIASIEAVADEIIVIDSSVEDSTTDIVAGLAAGNPKIKHVRFYLEGPYAFALACHIGLVTANYRWVFKWDSDFVAKSDEAMREWKSRLNALDKSKYYVVDLPRVNLEGDLAHQPVDVPYGIFEARVFTWSPELRWALKEGYWEQVTGDSIWGHRFPPWYKQLRWNEPYIFHCNIKSPRRMVLRRFWMDYMIHKEAGFPTLLAYAEFRVRKDWGMSMEEAERKVQNELMAKLLPYDKARFGELPKVLGGA